MRHPRIDYFLKKGDKIIMQRVDIRLDRMIEIADETGLTLDHVVKHMGRVDQTSFRAFSDNPSILPR
jgi:pilus assembly protein TadC